MDLAEVRRQYMALADAALAEYDRTRSVNGILALTRPYDAQVVANCGLHFGNLAQGVLDRGGKDADRKARFLVEIASMMMREGNRRAAAGT